MLLKRFGDVLLNDKVLAKEPGQDGKKPKA